MSRNHNCRSIWKKSNLLSLLAFRGGGQKKKSTIFLLFNNKPKYLLLYTNSCSHYWGCLWLYKLCFWHWLSAGLVVL